MKTLVIGATGTVGSLVTKNLLAKGESVRVLTRTADKAKALGDNVEVFVGDLTNPETVAAAFQGVDAIFLLNGVTQTETHEGLTAVALAKQNNVKKVVYMGVHNAHVAPFIPHFGSKCAIEEAIIASNLNYTFLQPNNFFQNDVWMKDALLQHGVYAQPIGEVGLNRVDVRDIADAAVNALTKTGFDKKAYALVGPTLVNGNSTAEIWATKLGKKISYAGDLNAWATTAATMMAPWMVFDMKVMYAHFQAAGLKATATELTECEKIVGHPLRTFDAYATETAAAWKA